MTILQSTESAEDRIVTHSRGGALACGAAALVAGLVYVNTLRNPFVYDDHHTVVENRSIEHLSDVRAIVLHDVTRPIVNFSYAIDRALWGATPIGFHVTNVLLHMLNVILLFTLGRRLADDRDRGVLVAFAAAVLFAAHPMMTEAVGYISGRSELLCAAFFLPAVLAGRRWLRGGGAVWALLTIGLWGAALAAKEIGAMFPFVLAVYDEYVERPTSDERRRRWRTVHLPLIGTAVAAGLVRVAILARIESPGRALVHWPYALVAFDVVRRYVLLLINPRNQTLFHEVAGIDSLFEWRALVAVGAIVLLVWIIWRLRSVDGVAGFGVAWFLLLLVPSAVLTILDQGEPMAEHRVYLASCGLFLAAGDGIGWLSAWAARAGARMRPLVPILLTLVVLSFGVDTLARNAVWASPVALWRESVTLAPTHYRPHLLLGEALQDEGNRDEAIAEYRTAIRLRPTDATGHTKLGAILVTMGRAWEARQEFDTALTLDPRNGTARQALTFLDRMEGRHGSDGARR
jgi:protein O-mannosyl-transferase